MNIDYREVSTLGSWDVSVFGNDEAKNWLREIVASSRTEPIFRALVLAAKVGADQFLQAPDCECALAAAELIAAARNKPATELPAEAGKWLAEQQFVAGLQVAELAIRVIERIASNSELKDVWEDTDSSAEWFENIRGLQKRLEESRDFGEHVAHLERELTPEQMCEQAAVLISESQYLEALALYDKALAIMPQSQLIYLGRAICHLWLRRYEQVIEDINKALSLDKKVPDAYQLRAQASFHLEKYRNAIADLSSYLQVRPNHFESYLIRGLSYENLQQYQNAINDFSILIDRKSSDHMREALNHRAACYDRLGRPDLAAWDRQYAMQLEMAATQI